MSILIIGNCSVNSLANETDSTSILSFSFEQEQINVNAPGDGYIIKGTTLTINRSGMYRITGSCTEGCILIDKGLTDVILILEDLNLACSTTSPLLCKKSTEVTILVSGNVMLTDTEDTASENSSDENVADAFEGAAIKAKAECSLRIEGNGTLVVDGSECKNGIKAGDSSTITVAMQEIGSLTVNAENDGIAGDNINILGGKLNIHSNSDAIQADRALTILGGDFDIKTINGYNTVGFDSDSSSAKGLKSDGSIDISGGVFRLDTIDDAIHSDDIVRITGGTFIIDTGDDGIHADNYLFLGSLNGLERDPMITINNCYEGMESSRVAIFKGKYSIIAADDGINAANIKNDNGSFITGVTTENHSITIYNGDIYIVAGADGIDSNGTLDILGGEIEIWAASLGVENALDYETTMTVNNARVFAAGCKGMGLAHPSGNSQCFNNYSKWFQAGQSLSVKSNESILYNAKAVKNASIVFYSDPKMTDEAVLAFCQETNCENGHGFTHQWKGEVTLPATEMTNGVMTYTCSVCGKTERQTIPMTEPSLLVPKEGYEVVLSADAHSDILVYRKTSEEDPGTLETIAPKGGKATVFCNECDEALFFTVEVRVDSTHELEGVSLAEDTAGLTLDLTNEETNSFIYTLTGITADTQISVKTKTENSTPSSNGNDGTGNGGGPGGGLSGGDVIEPSDTPLDEPEPDEPEPVDEPAPEILFEDVPDDAYFCDPVKWTVGKEITNGIDETHFGPEDSCTRAQMVTFLWRAAGCPEPTTADNPFMDVEAGSYYEKAVLWAVEKGITNGTSETTFSPNATVTRGQSVTFLYRYDGQKTDAEIPFEDVEDGAYYEEAVQWAVSKEITNGTSETTFEPDSPCTRGQIVTFLYRDLAE